MGEKEKTRDCKQDEREKAPEIRGEENKSKLEKGAKLLVH